MKRGTVGLAMALLACGGLGLGAGNAAAIPVGGGQWCPGDLDLYPQEMQQLAQLPGGLSVWVASRFRCKSAGAGSGFGG